MYRQSGRGAVQERLISVLIDMCVEISTEGAFRLSCTASNLYAIGAENLSWSQENSLLPRKQRQHIEAVTILRDRYLNVWIGTCMTFTMVHFVGY